LLKREEFPERSPKEGRGLLSTLKGKRNFGNFRDIFCEEERREGKGWKPRLRGKKENRAKGLKERQRLTQGDIFKRRKTSKERGAHKTESDQHNSGSTDSLSRGGIRRKFGKTQSQN